MPIVGDSGKVLGPPGTQDQKQQCQPRTTASLPCPGSFAAGGDPRCRSPPPNPTIQAWHSRDWHGANLFPHRPVCPTSRAIGEYPRLPPSIGGQAASFSRALALIIAAPFSAIMI